MKNLYRVLILFIALCGYQMNASAEVVERIVAVVGDRAILASELANQVQMYMLQAGQNANVDTEQLAKDMLDQMISDELILSAARDDTTVTASPDEIQYELDNHIAALANRFPNEEAFIQQLAREGLTKRALEKRLRPDIRDQILKRKIINKKLSEISLAREEVESFYEAKKDSLPQMPEKIKLSHILLKFKPSQATDSLLKSKAEEARNLLMQGLSFEDVASKFTDEGIHAVGGRIGFIRKSDVVEAFGRAAFSLQPGSISGPVRTEFGWHIIKNNKRLADSVDVSHILFPAVPSAADSARTKATIDSLYQALQEGADFKELAKAYSQDDDTRATGGEMKEMTLQELRPEFLAPLDSVEPGQITPPVISQLGYHILKLQERLPARALNMKDDYDVIRNFAQQDKTASIVEDWVKELKKQIYVDIKDYSITE